MSTWWGDFEIGVQQTLCWQIGPMTLWITRGDKEWRIATAEGRDPLDARLRIAEAAAEPVGGDVDIRRFALRGDDCTIRLVPALPDRPLIVKPADPFFVPTMDEVSLYVSAPLWLRVYKAKSGAELVDVALNRPTDTWFGPDTMSGQLCYASRSSARLHRESLPLRPHRSISVVRIRNTAKTVLKLEKLKVPVQHLGLFTSDEEHLWTEELMLEREGDSEGAQVRIVDRRKQIKNEKCVATPRIKMSKRFSLDAFGGLFG